MATPGEDDASLLRRYAAGDARAADRLVDRHGAAVYAFVRRTLGDGAHVDDLVQEAWLRVLRGAGSFDGRARFTTWLFAVTRNACLDHARRRARSPEAAPAPRDAGDGPDAGWGPVDPAPGVLDSVARRELSGLVEQAVADLSSVQREVFLLRETTDLSFDEIATALGLSKDTVKSRMRYALGHVRRFLRERLGVRVGDEEDRP